LEGAVRNAGYGAAKNRLRCFLALLVVLPRQEAAEKSEPNEVHHAKVKLIAEQTAILPGKRLWLGLKFQLDPDWHIYWVNPGDSGTAPQVKWDLPPGFSAGAMKWPTPVRLGKPPIVDYGYENEVLLLLSVEAPAKLRPGEQVTLGATVKWVVCREICIPDKAQLNLSLPIAKDGVNQSSAWLRVFQKTRERLPRQAPSGWTVRAASGKDQFTLTVDTGVPQTHAEFFPLEAQQVDNAAPQGTTSLPRGVRLTLKKSDQLLKPVSVLKGVLVLDGGRAYEIAAPVAPGK
jgi:DsbC/DsbD-like thiol-disulfide interchange protein